MLGEQINRVKKGGFINEYGRRLSSWTGTGEDLSGVLAVYPHAQANPGNNLLYSSSSSHNVEVIPLTDLDDLNFSPPIRSILHLHWVNDMFSNVSASEKQKIGDQYIRRIAYIQSLGWEVVWTVHNQLPHQCNNTKQVVDLYQRLCNIVDYIHIHNSNTIEIINKYTIPAKKTFHADIPSYVSALPNYISKEVGRAELNIPNNAIVVLAFGAILKYKNYEAVIDLVKRENIGEKSRVYLLIAGSPTDHVYSQLLLDKFGHLDYIRFVYKKISLEGMQSLFNASDVSFLGYKNALNSGVAITSLSYGVKLFGCADTVCYPYKLLGSQAGWFYGNDSEFDSLFAEMMMDIRKDPQSITERKDLKKSVDNIFNANKISNKFFAELQLTIKEGNA